MSDNPFREMPGENPYSTPTNKSDDPYGGANRLLIPAICLLLLASLFLIVLLASIPGQVIRISDLDVSTPQGVGELVGGVGTLVVWMALTVTIVVGSFSMLRLKGYNSAMTAAIVAIIPICSPCFFLGIPFGIWAILLLRKPEIKQRFIK